MSHVFFYPYRLTPRHAMNAVSRASIREGALLKWVDEEGRTGYSDLHPWPELGDAVLGQQLEGLRHRQFFPQVLRSQWLAERDAQARHQQRALFPAQAQLENNYLLPAIQDVTDDLLSYLAGQGFHVIKVKMGRDIPAEIKALETMAEAGFELRLDFNGTLTKDAYRNFVSRLSEKVKNQIQYVEDPFYYDFKNWSEVKELLPLAVDQYVGRLEWDHGSEFPFKVLVLKPAKWDVLPLVNQCEERGLKVTITSNMDHSVGVMHAASIAWELQQTHGSTMLVAGCLTHASYQSDGFSGLIKAQGPFMQPVPGFGIGFDKSLEELTWQPLI